MNKANRNTQSEILCPVCGSSGLRVFYEVADVPTNCNILWKSKDAAINCPKGHIKLAFCSTCSYITNLALEPEKNKYTNLYDNSLFYSPHFQNFSREFATNLIQRYDLHGKDIIEIGCGKGGTGDFLTLLCELGNNRGLGFDPTYSKAQAQKQDREIKNKVRYISNFFSKRAEDYKADFIFSWHVLEHMNFPKKFLSTLQRMIRNHSKTHVFFSVPNALNDFEKVLFLDIIYEHCSYFTPYSLAFIFSSCGFSVSEITEIEEGPSICIDAYPGKQKISDLKQELNFNIVKVEERIMSFAVQSRIIIEKFRNRLLHLLDEGQRVVVWGAGARGVTFLNTFKDPRIVYAVDINPRKQGMYIPGIGQMIVGPKFLLDYQPDFIVVVNPVYENEIKQLAESLGIKSNYISI